MNYFITGTDTDCGKTLVTLALIHASRAQGRCTLGMKPVATGAQPTSDGLRNPDALAIQAASSLELDYDLINPYCFEPAAAPHLAAEMAGLAIDFDLIREQMEHLAHPADVLFIEGAGGWRVPLNASQDMADLCVHLDLPVILVAEARLGWINHTLLSVESILQRGVQLAGWIANSRSAAMPMLEDNIRSLEARIPAPLLGRIPWLPDAKPAVVSSYLTSIWD